MNKTPAPWIVKHRRRPLTETASKMSKLLTTLIREPVSQMNEVFIKQRVKPTTTIKAKQQLLAEEVFSPIITKFRRERIIPLYKDETWSADLIDVMFK